MPVVAAQIIPTLLFRVTALFTERDGRTHDRDLRTGGHWHYAQGQGSWQGEFAKPLSDDL